MVVKGKVGVFVSHIKQWPCCSSFFHDPMGTEQGHQFDRQTYGILRMAIAILRKIPPVCRQIMAALANTMTELKVAQKRHYSAHNNLLRVGSNLLFACEQQERGCSEGHFVCLVMCSLAIESLCNTTGEMVYSDWKSEFESCSPRAKIRILCEKLGITYDKGIEPFQTLHWLIGFRNRIAHAKPEPIEINTLMTWSQYEELISGDGPQSKLEKEISIENAKKALYNVEKLKELFASKLPEESAWILESDSWEMQSGPNTGS